MSVPALAAPPALADPRPAIVEDDGRHLLAGARCLACGHALARRTARCPRCRGAVEPARFGPEGEIWATTIVHIAAAPGDEVPYALAYVDLDAGPRVLLRLDTAARRARIGDRVRLGTPTAAGSAAGVLLP